MNMTKISEGKYWTQKKKLESRQKKKVDDKIKINKQFGNEKIFL